MRQNLHYNNDVDNDNLYIYTNNLGDC